MPLRMRLKTSLFAKILLWFFLNLVLVASVLTAFFAFQPQVNLHAIFGQHRLVTPIFHLPLKHRPEHKAVVGNQHLHGDPPGRHGMSLSAYCLIIGGLPRAFHGRACYNSH